MSFSMDSDATTKLQPKQKVKQNIHDSKDRTF